MIASASVLPAAAVAPPRLQLTAGGYLRLRREAAGLTIAEVARAYAHSATARLPTELYLEEAERDLTVLPPRALERLRAIVPLDPDVYLDLADGVLLAGFAAPSICLGCGCTRHDACIDVGHAGACAWTDTSERCCTSCAARAAGAIA